MMILITSLVSYNSSYGVHQNENPQFVENCIKYIDSFSASSIKKVGSDFCKQIRFYSNGKVGVKINTLDEIRPDYPYEGASYSYWRELGNEEFVGELRISSSSGVQYSKPFVFVNCKYIGCIDNSINLNGLGIRYNLDEKYTIGFYEDEHLIAFDSFTPHYPVPEKLTLTSKNPTVEIDGILRKENALTEQWLVQFKLCAGEKTLSTPEIRIKTDVEDVTIKLKKIINAGSCGYSDIYDVKAIDPQSIEASFFGAYSETSLNENAKKIPEWIKNVFRFYVEGQISENDMIEALQFLIKEGIIKV